ASLGRAEGGVRVRWAAGAPQRGKQGLGNPAAQRMVQSKPQPGTAQGGYGNVVAWQVDASKSVVLLEIAQAIALLPAVGEAPVQQTRDAAFRARAHGVGDQGVGRRLV